ncbi:MAG: peptidoglycan DD-metalloendopeptidase family protein [Candidatus Altimarinota bacterium]
MKNIFPKLLLTISILLPFSAQAALLPDQQIPQGETVELIIPKFEFSSAQGTFDGKNFDFYQTTKLPDPAAPISRAEFMQLIYLNQTTQPSNLSTESSFPDVSNTNPFFPAIQSAYQNNIIDGYEDGLFHPYDSVTRAQASKIIMNTFNPPEIIQDIQFFPDLPLTHSLRDQVYEAVKAGVFKGYPDGKMLPDRAINFHEANLIVQRAGQIENLVSLPERQVFRAFLGIHRLVEIGNKNLQIKLTDSTGKTSTENSTITVTKQIFPTQSFSMAESETDLFADDYQDKTWAMIDGAKSQPSATQLWSGPFIIPAKGEITLGFGDKLYINGKYSGSHFGIDYANQQGTPVYAANNGIVTLSAYTPAYGNTIVIDHGQNVYTMYLHLHELKITEGSTVKTGDLIATIGATGIATGPHLHFTHFIGGIIVNSQPWFDGKY